jgi:hypothetical protein
VPKIIYKGCLRVSVEYATNGANVFQFSKCGIQYFTIKSCLLLYWMINNETTKAGKSAHGFFLAPSPSFFSLLSPLLSFFLLRNKNNNHTVVCE